MSSYITLIVLVVLLVGMVGYTRWARRRQATAMAEQLEAITAGSQVMTTSGLYGTVSSVNDDESVQLTIAPGVEVRWATAALRDVQGLPDRYRGADPGEAGETDDTSSAGAATAQ